MNQVRGDLVLFTEVLMTRSAVWLKSKWNTQAGGEKHPINTGSSLKQV